MSGRSTAEPSSFVAGAGRGKHGPTQRRDAFTVAGKSFFTGTMDPHAVAAAIIAHVTPVAFVAASRL